MHGKEEESDLQSYYIIELAMVISPQVKGIDRDHPHESPGIEYARQGIDDKQAHKRTFNTISN